MTRVTTLVPVLAVGVLTLSACAQVQLAARPTAPDPVLADCDGALVVVDDRELGETGHGGYSDPRSICVPVDGPATAQEVVAAANVTATRSEADQVCRVDGVPEEFEGLTRPGGGLYFEHCTTAAPEYARWVVWHQDADGVWSDADQDLRSVPVEAGERIALVYSYDGAATPPGT